MIRGLFPFFLLLALPAWLAASQSVGLSWDPSASSDTVGYNVYCRSADGTQTAMISVAGGISVRVYNLDEGLTYIFTVTAYNSSHQESDPSNEQSYTVPGESPPAYAPFVEQVLADYSLVLGWNPSSSADVLGYYVYYGTQSGIYGGPIWVAGATEANIPSLAPDVTYYFAVTAVDSFGLESDYSPELSYSILQMEPPPAAPGLQQIATYPAITVSWNSSLSAGVAGYNVYYGTQPGVYDTWFDVGLASSFDVWSLTEGRTYYFAVSSYNSDGQESPLSVESSFFLPQATPLIPVDPGVVLSLQQIPIDGFPNAFEITAAGTMPASWTLQGSSDLKRWHTLITGVDPQLDVTVVVSEKPALFFRLASWFDDLALELDTNGADQYPGSFVVSTPYYVPWDWTLESSEDLQNWSPFIAGYFTAVEAVIVPAPTSAMFFRLKGN